MTTTVASPLRDDLFRSGYVVVPDVIDPGGVLQPVLDEYAQVLDGLARDLAAAGSISNSYEDLPFEARLIQIAKESGATHTQHFDITLLTGSDSAILEYLILGAEGTLIGVRRHSDRSQCRDVAGGTRWRIREGARDLGPAAAAGNVLLEPTDPRHASTHEGGVGPLRDIPGGDRRLHCGK